MKLLVASVFISLAGLLLFYGFNYNRQKNPITISCEQGPRKAKPGATQNSKLNLSVYENFSDIKNIGKIKAKVLHEEKPINIASDSNIIEKVISNYMDNPQIFNHNGIKITVRPITNINSRNTSKSKHLIPNNSYTIDLGSYLSQERAANRFHNALKIEPILKAYRVTYDEVKFKERILYNLTLQGIPNFNIAFNTCKKLNNSAIDCIVVGQL